MTNRQWLKLISLAFFFACAVPGAHAQNYAIDWFKIAGGGGTSAGGRFVVTGTVGQTDAGTQPMSGGRYMVNGGFWALYAVQTPGSPKLSLTTTATNTIVVSWPWPSTGWTLQNSGNLGASNWTLATQAVNNDGVNNFIVLSPPNGTRFYRLNKP
jgi:hypothetical protein